eukprot:565466-Rhodomonas_salina.1
MECLVCLREQLAPHQVHVPPLTRFYFRVFPTPCFHVRVVSNARAAVRVFRSHALNMREAYTPRAKSDSDCRTRDAVEARASAAAARGVDGAAARAALAEDGAGERARGPVLQRTLGAHL